MNVSFGIVCPQGWRRELSNVKPSDRYEAIRQTAITAENLGFDSLWLYDHLITLPPRAEPCFECWTTLAALASETKNIRIGSLVTCCSYRHPSLIAKMGATLDNISKGRLEFGIGAGWYWLEFQKYGIPFQPLNIRIRMLEEAILIIKKLWSEERSTFKGKYYQIENSVFEPKPVQKPHPPIWIGGSSNSILRLVAKYANGCNLELKPFACERKLKTLDKLCKEIGRDSTHIQKSLHAIVIIGEDENEVRERAKRFFKTSRLSLTEKFRLALKEPGKALSYVRKRVISSHVGYILGSPDECAKQLIQFRKVGLTHFMLYIVDALELEPLRLFSKRVVPLVIRKLN
jgi:F420-dependent oxidoreductase-like protein